MTTKPVAQVLREAARAVPRVRWASCGATVEIPDTGDWAGKALSITGLHRPVARAYARHIAAANPANVMDLLAQRDELLTKLEAWQAVCDRIVDQYDGVVAGVDFAALGRANRAAISKAKGERE